MDLAEAFVKHLIRDAKEHCAATSNSSPSSSTRT